MNAQELYDAMKQALRFLELSWGDLDAMQVSLRDKRLVFSYEGREAVVLLPDNVEGKRP